ncbi:MAG: hypothetical protein [Microviridae sp.]|nr:MAG: hypothetical protein [Microviridae sp.]
MSAYAVLESRFDGFFADLRFSGDFCGVVLTPACEPLFAGRAFTRARAYSYSYLTEGSSSYPMCLHSDDSMCTVQVIAIVCDRCLLR